MATKNTKFINRLFSKDSFVSNVLTLMSGTAFAQVIAMIAIPVLTRFYKPESFGILSIFAGTASIITVWAALRYELAIVIPEKKEDAIALVKLSFIITILISLLILIIIIAFGLRITRFFNLLYIDPWLKFLPLSILFAGSYNILIYWCNRNKRFDKISISKVTQSISTVLSQLIGYLLLKAGAGGLIAGYIIGQISGVWTLLKQVKDIKVRESISTLLDLKVAKTYSAFPKFSGLGAFFDTAASQIPLIAIPILFSPHVGGLYAFADRLLRAPSGLIGTSVSQVFFQRMAQSKRDRNIRGELIFNTWKYLIFLGIVPMSIVFIFGPNLFGFFLGAHWREAGQYAQILSIGFMAHFVGYPTSLGIVALERLDILLGWQILNFISMILVLVFGYIFLRNNIFSFLWMWTFKEFVVYILYMLALWRAHTHEKISTHSADLSI